MPECTPATPASPPRFRLKFSDVAVYVIYNFPEIVVFALALLLRVIYVGQISDSPLFDAPLFDAARYDQDAQRIAGGDWIGEEVFFQAPLYSYFLGVLYAIFGHNFLIPRLVQILLGAISAVMVCRLGRRIFSPGIGLLAGAIFALNGPMLQFTGDLLPTTLYVFFIVWLLLKLDHLLTKPSLWNFILAGLLLGLAALTHPLIMVFAPLALFWILFRLKEPLPTLTHRVRGGLFFTLATVAVILPVTIRNYAVGQDFVLISSQGGVNFYMGNNPYSDGHSAWVPRTTDNWWEEAYPATIRIAERASQRQLKPSEVSAYWASRASAEMSTRWKKWYFLTRDKFRYLIAGYEITNWDGVHFQRRFSSLLALLMWEKVVTFPFGLLLPLGLLGLALSFRWRRQSHLILYLISYALAIVAFFVCSRFRMPLIPILSIWTAVGIVELMRLIKQRQVHHYVLVLVGFVVLLFAVNRNPIRKAERPMFDGLVNLGNVHLQKGQLPEAISVFQEATLLDSMSGRPRQGMGLAYLSQRKLDDAKSEFIKALLLEPSLNQARNNYARLLQQEGKPDSAARQFESVLALDSNNVFARQGLADVMLDLGHLEAARVNYQRAFELGSADRIVISRWAYALAQQGKIDEALQVNAKLLASEPNNARAHHNQARLYLACDSLEQAARELEIVLQLNPSSPEAQQQLEELRKKRR